MLREPKNLYICNVVFKKQETMYKRIYPIGIQNFEKIRKDGYVYVDKTAVIHRLVKTGSYYFLSRPRRFGKSLLLSTLHAYFDGKRELFEGLAIEQLEQDWTKHPVLHMDLNIGKYDTPESLDHILDETLSRWEDIYGTGKAEATPALRFAGIIRRAHQQTGQRVAILVDEYDKPMLQAIGNEELQRYYRDTLKPFYGVLKTMDGDIQIGFLTGVTKFSKVSVFSDLNNLIDISMDRRYLTLCGITEEELHRDFDEDIHTLAEVQGMSFEETCLKLKENYDGYHFTYNSIGIYNPFSLLNTFAKMEFSNYWFQTGTPSYLVELLQKHDYDLYRLTHEETSAKLLDSIDSMDANPIPVIYQSGYLTIKGYDQEFDTYRLGFPNSEVERSFIDYLLPFYTGKTESKSEFDIQKFIREVRSGNYESFFRRLAAFFSDIPYDMAAGFSLERHYQNVLFIIFRLLGFYTKVEYHTSEGRVDLVMQTDHFTYVMEFKLDGTAEEALQQIEEKHYAAPFAADTQRKLFKAGINFSKETHGIERWLVVE